MGHAMFGLFLVVHGLIHLGWVAPKPDDPTYPFRLTHAALFRSADPRRLARIGAVLVVVSTACFVMAGLGVWGVPGFDALWPVLAIVGSGVSLAVVATFWHRWFLVSPLLDVGIIVVAVLGLPMA